MTGSLGFLVQLITVAIPGAIAGLTVWARIRKPSRIQFVVPFVFTIVFCFFFLIFLRQGLKIHDLQHLNPAGVSSVSYERTTYRDPNRIRSVVEALNQTQWYSTRRSAIVGAQTLSVHFKDGTEWELLVGANRYGPGTVIQLSVDGLSSGYGYNLRLRDVLLQP